MFVVLVVLIWRTTASSQVDTSGTEEFVTADSMEQLTEQAPQEENSSLLDESPIDQMKTQSSIVTFRSRVTQSLQESAGYLNGKYLGTPVKSFQRLTVNEGEHLSGGILLEKDAGEERFNEFISGNIMLSAAGPVSKLIVGDYHIESGQGLTLWRGYDFSKGAAVIMPAKKTARGLLESVSSNENSFLSGIAAQLQTQKFSGVLFYSHRLLSGSLDSLDRLTTFTSSGYFRTLSELSRKHNVVENMEGGRIAYSPSTGMSVGATMYFTDFSRMLWLGDGLRFSGSAYSLLSVDYNVGIGSSLFFGEWSHSSNTLAGTSGILVSPLQSVTLIASFRHYPYRFMNIHGVGFGERSSTPNEDGLYIGIELKSVRWAKFSLYIDAFKFPEATSVSQFPFVGNDILTNVEMNPARRWKVTIQYQNKATEGQEKIANQMEDGQRITNIIRKRRVRLEVDYRYSKDVRLRGRCEEVFIDAKFSNYNEHGFLLYQDIVMDQGVTWWNGRVTFFHSDSYESRVYDVERDLNGVLTQRGLYGRGVCWYVLVKYNMFNRLSYSVKYSDIIREDVKHIGSGLDELPSNHDNRIGMQIDFSL